MLVLGPPPVVPLCVQAPAGMAVVVSLDPARHATVIAHGARAVGRGHPVVLHIDRPGAVLRRALSLRGAPRAPGMDRDEYPPAVSAEGGAGADVELVPATANRSAGAVMGARLRPFCDGEPFVVGSASR